MIEYWIEDKVDFFQQQKNLSCPLWYLWCAALLSKMLISWILDANYRVWKQHCMLYLYTLHWSQSCLIDMFYQCVKMPGLWYEFNDTQHDSKACQRCNDKKLCLVLYRCADMNLHWKSHHHGGDWSDDCQQEFTIHTLILVECSLSWAKAMVGN